jgi:hypothetical protein
LITGSMFKQPITNHQSLLRVCSFPHSNMKTSISQKQHIMTTMKCWTARRGATLSGCRSRRALSGNRPKSGGYGTHSYDTTGNTGAGAIIAGGGQDTRKLPFQGLVREEIGSKLAVLRGAICHRRRSSPRPTQAAWQQSSPDPGQDVAPLQILPGQGTSSVTSCWP